MKTYTFTGRRGIDDLKPEYTFMSTMQGDTSVSSSVKDIDNPYLKYVLETLPITQEGIEKEIQKNREYNIQYVEQLRKEDRFGEEYQIAVHFVEHSFLDTPNNSLKLKSFDFKLIDMSEFQGEPNIQEVK